jgi:spore coat protein A
MSGKSRFALGVLLLVVTASATSASAQALLDPAIQPKFVNPLPIPARIDATRGGFFVMDMKETTQSLGLVDPAGNPLETTVWGYGKWFRPVTYPGPTFVTRKNKPVWILWRNKLPMYNFPDGPGAHLLPVDPTLHMAHPPDGGIPTVTHLHGGHTESASDGLPEQWYTQGWGEVGEQFVKPVFKYHNDQEAATLWYHDHALGITRLNVYAGLAGFYLLRDKNEDKLAKKNVLPGGPYEIEIVIQDRMFTDDGSLFYPSQDPELEPGFEPLPPGPSVIAEFFGDFILVNGAAWPRLEVEPRKYRLRYLNGSDSRFYVLEFRDGMMGGTAQSFLQIGTDNGLLPHPVQLTQLLLAPGERADLVVDFKGFTELYMRNFGPDDPFKGFNPDGSISDGEGGVAPPADPATTGQIMKFVVNLPLKCDDDDDDDDDDGDDHDGAVMYKPKKCDASVDVRTRLRDDIMPLAQTGDTRNLVLFEGLDEYGRLQPLLGTLAEGSMAWFQPITENPMLDDVEVWEVYNATEDAHPIHLHLVSFQIVNRESFTGYVDEIPQPQHNGTFGVGGKLTVTALGGDARDPEDNEGGWKDTAVMLPGEVTRVIAKFDRPGRYVWHCHILSHEDHEMMRPFFVGPMATSFALDNRPSSEADRAAPRELALDQNYPNPFNPVTNIRFHLPREGSAELKVFNVSGQEVRTLASGVHNAGTHVATWDGRDNAGSSVASGVYFYQLRANGRMFVKKMVMMK